MSGQYNVLGVNIAETNLQKACGDIERLIVQKKSAYICIAPVSTIVDCQKDEEYLKVINQSSMTTPDGMPVVWLGKVKGCKSVSRTYGPDLLESFCAISNEKDYRHYFYGGTEETLDLLKKTLVSKFPKLNIVGSYAPPFRQMKEFEEERIIDEINLLQPDVLWIGLGSPKQDFWMYQHKSKLKVGVMIGVGAAFDFIAGTKKQAPRWMQRSGLEWFFRLCSEPKRLWKRYLIGNTQFLYFLIKESLFKEPIK